MSVNQSTVGQIGSGILKGIGAVVCIIGLIVGYQLYDEHGDDAFDEQLAPLRVGLDEFLTIVSSGSGLPPSTDVARPKVVMRCMATNGNLLDAGDRTTREIDPLTLSLPDELRAESAAEVNTIAALFWWEESMGEYDNGDHACRETRTVEVFDRETGAVVARTHVLGGDPPGSVLTHGLIRHGPDS